MSKQAKLTPEEQDLLKGDAKNDKAAGRKAANPVVDPIVDAAEADAGKTTAPPQTLGEELDERKVDAKAAAKEQAEVDKLFQGKDDAEASIPRGELSPAQYDDDGWGDTPVQMRGK